MSDHGGWDRRSTDASRPLEPWERRILRGMIDEYEQARQRRRIVTGLGTDVKNALLFLAVVGSLIVQAIALILHVRG